MTHQKLTDAIASTDQQTQLWKARFSAAKAAYAAGDFRQCETLLFRSMELAKTLQESTFAINTCHVGLGAAYLATGKIDKAQEHLDSTIRALSGSNDPALKELYAVALRFHSAIFFEKGEQDSAEKELQEAMKTLEDVGIEGAVQLAYVTGDLATLYVMKGNLKDAKALIFSAMALIEGSLGPENPEYVRANMIYNICDSEGDEERLAQIEDGIYDMQYQRGQNHPHILRALRWYLKKREERGESELVAEAKERFALHDKALKY